MTDARPWHEHAARVGHTHRPVDSQVARRELGMAPLPAFSVRVHGWDRTGLRVTCPLEIWRASGRLVSGRAAELDGVSVDVVGHRRFGGAYYVAQEAHHVVASLDADMRTRPEGMSLWLDAPPLRTVVLASGVRLRLGFRRGLTLAVPIEVDPDERLVGASVSATYLGAPVTLDLGGRAWDDELWIYTVTNDPALVRFADGAQLIATD